MRFEELSKKHQEFLMYCLSDYIKGKIRKGSMDGIIFPSYDEYEQAQGRKALPLAKVPGTARLLSKFAIR